MRLCARGAHRDWYLDLVERAAPDLLGPGQVRMLDRLELEHDNLRTALAFCQVDPDGDDAAVRFVAALGRFWHWRGHVTEGCDWFARVLSRPGGTAWVRSTAYWQAAMLEWRNANNEVARGLAEQSIALGRTIDDTDVLATGFAITPAFLLHCATSPRPRRRLKSASPLHERVATVEILPMLSASWAFCATCRASCD